MSKGKMSPLWGLCGPFQSRNNATAGGMGNGWVHIICILTWGRSSFRRMRSEGVSFFFLSFFLSSFFFLLSSFFFLLSSFFFLLLLLLLLLSSVFFLSFFFFLLLSLVLRRGCQKVKFAQSPTRLTPHAFRHQIPRNNISQNSP